AQRRRQGPARLGARALQPVAGRYAIAQHRTYLSTRAAQYSLKEAPAMSCYLVELYTPNATWQALPAAQRQQFLATIGQGLGQLSSLGIELLSLAEADAAIAQASPHQYLGIWRF